jgi:hypothetical protein
VKKLFAAFIAITGTALASDIMFATAPGATVTSGSATLPVSAHADFIFGSNSVTLQIFNDITGPTGVLQNISSIYFDLYTDTGIYTGPVTITGLNAYTVTVGNHGTYTTSSITSLPANSWTIAFETGSTDAYHLTALGTAHPQYTIIGWPDDSTYSSNGSFQSGSHNPFLQSGALFTLSAPGAVLTNVGHVQFAFGTSPGIMSAADEAPEPAMLGSVGLALLGIAGVIRRFRSRTTAPGSE